MKHRNSRMLLTVLGLSGRGPALRDAPSDSGAGDGTNGGGGTNTGGDGGDDKGGSGTGDDGKKGPVIDGNVDPDRASRAIAAARDGEKAAKKAKAEAEAKHQSMLDGIAVALGLKPDPKTDPTALVAQAAKERDDARAKAAAKATELAIYRAAGKASANPDALLDSRKFLTDLGQLDPDADDFDAKVEAAVKAAVKANPNLGTKSATGRMGTDVTGSGGGGGERPTSLREAYARKNN